MKNLTHPHIIEKIKKRHVVLGFLADFDKKKFEIFHQYHPQLPPTGAISCILYQLYLERLTHR